MPNNNKDVVQTPVVGTKATADGRGRLPYQLVSTDGKVVKFTFDGESYSVTLNNTMMSYLLDAGLRTRISAAGAGADKGIPEQLKAIDNLVRGIVGRVGADVGVIVEAIASMEELAQVVEATGLVKAAPKSKQAELLGLLNDKIVELATAA